MKNLLVLGLVLLATSISAQTVNKQEIRSLDNEYVTLVGVSKAFSSKLTIVIDYGQELNVFKARETSMVLDTSGVPVVLNSMTHALNFMYENGYEFVSNYTLTTGQSNVYYYILRKRQ